MFLEENDFKNVQKNWNENIINIFTHIYQCAQDSDTYCTYFEEYLIFIHNEANVNYSIEHIIKYQYKHGKNTLFRTFSFDSAI